MAFKILGGSVGKITRRLTWRRKVGRIRRRSRGPSSQAREANVATRHFYLLLQTHSRRVVSHGKAGRNPR